MKPTLFAALAVLACGSAVAADFTMKPGRWEIVLDVKMARPSPGMPFSEPLRMIQCPTESAQLTEQLIKSIQEDGDCKVSNYRQQGEDMLFTLDCEEAKFDYRMTQVSGDLFTATGKSHSKDPDYQMTFTYSAKRTGPACSAKEQTDSL